MNVLGRRKTGTKKRDLRKLSLVEFARNANLRIFIRRVIMIAYYYVYLSKISKNFVRNFLICSRV